MSITYFIAHLLSKLPLSVLYRISGGIAFFLRELIQYRRVVVEKNLGVLAGQPEEVKKRIAEFYAFLSEIIVEYIKLFSLSEKEIVRMMQYENRDIMQRHFQERQSVIIVLGHTGNWELAGLAASIYLDHQCVAFYKPAKTRWVDFLIKKMRTRYGMKLLPETGVRQLYTLLKSSSKPLAIFLPADQSPHKPEAAVWVDFLGRQTAFYPGLERLSRQLDFPVYYAELSKLKRGEYVMRPILISEKPSLEPTDTITATFAHYLGEHIRHNPAQWLWSHKRWKHTRNN